MVFREVRGEGVGGAVDAGWLRWRHVESDDDDDVQGRRGWGSNVGCAKSVAGNLLAQNKGNEWDQEYLPWCTRSHSLGNSNSDLGICRNMGLYVHSASVPY